MSRLLEGDVGSGKLSFAAPTYATVINRPNDKVKIKFKILGT